MRKYKKLKSAVLITDRATKESLTAEIIKQKIKARHKAEIKSSCVPCWRGFDEKILD